MLREKLQTQDHCFSNSQQASPSLRSEIEKVDAPHHVEHLQHLVQLSCDEVDHEDLQLMKKRYSHSFLFFSLC